MPSSGQYESIAEKYLTPVVRGTSEYMTTCPFCDGRASLQFNIDSGLWVCFRCEKKGNAKSLVQQLGGTYADPVVSVHAIYERLDRIHMAQKQKDEGPRVYDEAYLKRFEFPDEYWSEVRGFRQATIEKWQLGYDPIKDRHTIPYRSPDGELLGVIQRLGDKEAEAAEIRYIYDKSFNRKESLFGSWAIHSRKIALVEGSTDVLALDDSGSDDGVIPGIPAAGQYGSSISKAQIRLLHRLGVEEVVLFYDYDEAGKKAEEKARQYLDGMVLRAVEWDTSKYCWHKKLCGCGNHTWRNIGQCKKKFLCKCRRIHEADPGSLKRKERRRMYEEAVLVGKVKPKWRMRPSVS